MLHMLLHYLVEHYCQQKFLKSVKNWQNYGHESVAPFFRPTLYSVKRLFCVLFSVNISAAVHGLYYWCTVYIDGWLSVLALCQCSLRSRFVCKNTYKTILSSPAATLEHTSLLLPRVPTILVNTTDKNWINMVGNASPWTYVLAVCWSFSTDVDADVIV